MGKVELVKEITKEVLDAHNKWLNNEEGGVGLITASGDVKVSVNLCGADLRGVNFSGSNLYNTDLHNSDLRGANLCFANLSNANLRNADLRGAILNSTDLRGADLRGADLRGADIDFSCWPLWCGSNHVKVDARIAAQIAAHFCALDCDDPAYQAARDAILDFARTGCHAEKLDI